MRWIAVFALAIGCVGHTPTGDELSEDPSSSQPGPGGGEIDGTYLDVTHGVCVGGVGGAIRCAGSPCDAIEDATTCAAAAGCFVALDANTAFRDCFPIDTRTTAAGVCADLAAGDCATRADCSAVYDGVSIYGSFVRCQDEAP